MSGCECNRGKYHRGIPCPNEAIKTKRLSDPQLCASCLRHVYAKEHEDAEDAEAAQ